MAVRRRGSIRFWQTGLFVAVIVVAILILSGSLSAGLTSTLARMAETSELRNAAALAQRMEPEFPLGVSGTSGVRTVLAEYRDIYGGGIWVYNADGDLLEAGFDTAPVDAALEVARLGALGQDASYAASDLRPGGWIVAAKPVRPAGGAIEAVVITASSADPSVAILRAVRDRLWVAFWVSLAIAGLLGFGFSELISRRIRAMSDAAVAIAAGDFAQQLPTSLVPAEIQDLAESYNTMAAHLGEAFGAIQASRGQIAAVVESMAEGVLALDAAGVVRVINPEAARLLAIPPDVDPTGAGIQTLTGETDVLDVVHAGLGGAVAARTLTLGAHVVSLHCTPLLGGEDAVDGAVLLLADVTERHRIEDAQRRFVADASHEMRTPIAALKGILELLEDGAKENPEVRDDFIHTMQAEADRLGRLVADLLTLAQLEAGGMRLDLAPEYVVDVFGDVTNVMQTLAEQADVRLEVAVPDDELRVMADHDRIVQVLLSFTDNALKHAPGGSVVRLAAVVAEDAVRLEVSDEGPGIDPDEVARVFERFYRADAARPRGGGTGLGLAIAKEIVEAHGSRIDVRSTPGTGTTFAFELPVA